MSNKLNLGLISLFLGISMLGSNFMALAVQGHASAGSFFGFFGAAMLIMLAFWDFADHYAEISTKADRVDRLEK